MNRTLAAVSFLIFIFPFTVLADLNQTIVLQTNSRLSLDTGDTPSSGGDLL